MSCRPGQAHDKSQAQGSTGIPPGTPITAVPWERIMGIERPLPPQDRPTFAGQAPLREIMGCPVVDEGVIRLARGKWRQYRVSVIQTDPGRSEPDSLAYYVEVFDVLANARGMTSASIWRDLPEEESRKLPKAVTRLGKVMLRSVQRRAAVRPVLDDLLPTIPPELHRLAGIVSGCDNLAEYGELVAAAASLNFAHFRLGLRGCDTAQEFQHLRAGVVADLRQILGVLDSSQEDSEADPISAALNRLADEVVPQQGRGEAGGEDGIARRILLNLPAEVRDTLFDPDGSTRTNSPRTRLKIEVERALAAGQPVEPAVLIQFPDLLARYGVS